MILKRFYQDDLSMNEIYLDSTWIDCTPYNISLMSIFMDIIGANPWGWGGRDPQILGWWEVGSSGLHEIFVYHIMGLL